jgi:hypothetical protein
VAAPDGSEQVNSRSRATSFDLERRASRLSGLVAQQAVDALFSVALLPAPDRRSADARAPGDFQNREPLSGMEHDLRALDVLEGTGPIAGDHPQPLAVFVAEDDADSLGHDTRLARRTAIVNPMSASVH